MAQFGTTKVGYFVNKFQIIVKFFCEKMTVLWLFGCWLRIGGILCVGGFAWVLLFLLFLLVGIIEV